MQHLKRLAPLSKCTHRLLSMTSICFLCVGETSHMVNHSQTGDTLQTGLLLFLWRTNKGRMVWSLEIWCMDVRKPITTQDKGTITLIVPPCRWRQCGVYKTLPYTTPPRWNEMKWNETKRHTQGRSVVLSGLCSSLSFRHLQSLNIHHIHTVYFSNARWHGVNCDVRAF